MVTRSAGNQRKETRLSPAKKKEPRAKPRSAHFPSKKEKEKTASGWKGQKKRVRGAVPARQEKRPVARGFEKKTGKPSVERDPLATRRDGVVKEEN